MMTRRFIAISRIGSLSAAVLGLAACGGVTAIPTPPSPAEYQAFLDGFSELRDAVDETDATNFAGRPMTGNATYVGISYLEIERPDDVIKMLGDARVNVSLGSGTLTGSLTNFIGGIVPNPDEAIPDDLTAFSGALSLDEGVIGTVVLDVIGPGESGSLAGVLTDVRGTLTGGGMSIDVDVPTGGYLYGPNAELLRTSGNGTAVVNGQPFDAFSNIVGRSQ